MQLAAYLIIEDEAAVRFEVNTTVLRASRLEASASLLALATIVP